MTITLSAILPSDRLRKNLGDISSLASNISQNGLIHPVVVSRSGSNFTLVAGGRRLAAISSLGYTELYHGLTCTPGKAGFVFAEELSEDVRKELELDENLHRLDMDWKEKVKGYCDLHRLFVKRAALKNEEWTQAQTAARVGYSRAFITNNLKIEPLLEESQYASCESFDEACKVYDRAIADRAMAELAKRTLNLQSIPKDSPEGAAFVTDELSTLIKSVDENVIEQTVQIPLSSMLYHGDCRTILSSFPTESVDHIITDWPYAIDIDNIDQSTSMLKDVDRIKDTHQVDENLQLQQEVLPLLFRVLKPGGFCLIWHDAMFFRWTHDLALSRGFSVQRWPLIGIKPSAGNSMAHVNFTKATEQVIVLRKGVAKLINTNVLNHFPMPAPSEALSNPFVKSFEAWRYLIENVSIQGQTILDPFAGEGSCPLACLALGRKILAIEKDPTHWPYLVERVSQHYRIAFPNCTFV